MSSLISHKTIRFYLVITMFFFIYGCSDMTQDEGESLAESKNSVLIAGDSCAKGCIWSISAVSLGAQSVEEICDEGKCACVVDGDIYSSCQVQPTPSVESIQVDPNDLVDAIAGDSCARGCIWSTYAVSAGVQNSQGDCQGSQCACVADGDIYDLCQISDGPTTNPREPEVEQNQNEMPQVPYFFQYDNAYYPSASCQNTSIAMVLAYLGWSGIPDDITRAYGKDYAQSPAGLADLFNRYVDRNGLSMRISPNTNGSIQGLKAELDKGHPVIVHGYFTNYGHVLVVLGYDQNGYYVNDPAGKWSEYFKGGYPGLGSGRDVFYRKDAFERAIGTDGYSNLPLWYHALR